MEQVKSADYKSGQQREHRCAEKKEQQPKQISRRGSLRQKIIARSDESDGNRYQRNETDEPVKDDREQCARFFVRSLLEQGIAFHDVAARPSGEELVKKHADVEQTHEARKTQMNLLDLQQHVPAKSGSNFHDHVCQNPKGDPSILSVSDRLNHLRASVGIVINPVEHRDGDAKLEKADQYLFHSPMRSFHILIDRRILSAVVSGCISQTNKQFVGRSGTSFAKATPPV